MGHFLIRSTWETAPKPLPSGSMLFAIGDVHGRADLLSSMHDVISAEAKSADTSDITLVRVGDFIDRGPDSLGALDLARRGLCLPKVREINLRGNHEAYCYEFATDTETNIHFLFSWIDDGAKPTLAQLGFGTDDLYCLTLQEMRQRVVAGLGSERMTFLESLKSMHRVGDYLCVHAGIDPRRELDDQDEYDLLTIRERFLVAQSEWRHPVIVVHGHSISAPSVQPHRIGVDTGAFYSGALTALQVEGHRLRFLIVTDRDSPFSHLRLKPSGNQREYASAVHLR